MTQWPSWLPLRSDLADLKPYGAPQIDVPVRLNTNENPFPLSEVIQREIAMAITKNLEHLNRYPDRDAMELRGALADFINSQSETSFTASHIWAANGSNEILQSLMLAFAGDYCGFEPSYSMHPLIAKTLGREFRVIQRSANFTIDLNESMNEIAGRGAGLIFVTSPNNPTGDSISLDDLRTIAAEARKVKKLVIVDEAYAEFSSRESAVSLIDDFPNIAVVRTMSKAFAFAGTRLGYLVAQPEVISSMLLVRLPYHLSSLTQAAGLAALGMRSEFLSHVEEIKRERTFVHEGLLALGLHPLPSDANFILFSGFTHTSTELWNSLVDRGVLIRDVGIAGYLRVTIGTHRENQLFLEALRASL